MPDREREQRRAEVAGEAVLKFAKRDRQFAIVLRDILEGSITDPADRELLGLKAQIPVRRHLLNREAQRAVFADLGADSILGQ